VLQQQARDLRPGPQLEIRAAVAGRAQEGLGGVPAPSLALVDLEIRHAVVVAPVEILGGRDAGLLSGLRKGIQHIPAQALFLHPPFAARGALAAPSVGALVRGRAAVEAGPFLLICAAWSRVLRRVEAVVVLVGHEGGQHLLPAPRVVAGQCGPLVVVARLAAHVDHAVDARTAAQHLAARIPQRAAVQTRLGFGAELPIRSGIADAVEIAHRDVDPVVVVLAAGLDQQHPLGRIGTEPVGHQCAGRTGSDHDVVETVALVARCFWCRTHVGLSPGVLVRGPGWAVRNLPAAMKKAARRLLSF